jgi:hemerythrin
MPETAGWREDLETGNPEIDNQHKEIFRRAGMLLGKLKTGNVSDEEIKNMVEFMSDYVVEHFGMEEVLQKLFDYPAFEAHRAKHESFIRDFVLLKERYEVGWAPNMAEDLGRLVVTWLMDHIEKEDKAAAAYIKKTRG